MNQIEPTGEPPVVTNPLAESESLLLAIINAVAAVENETITSLPALSEAIDIEALETLIESAEGELWVSFIYASHHLVVTSERVEVY